MKNILFSTLGIALLILNVACGSNRSSEITSDDALRGRLDSIIALHDGEIGVAVIARGGTIVAGDSTQLPLMSIFKLHIAVAILEQGLPVDSVIKVDASAIRENTYSPLRDSVGVRDIEITVDRLLYYSVCRSDNNACDILIDLAGGIGAVDSCMRRLGIADFILTETENSMHEDISRSYVNRSTPVELCRVMEAVYDGKALSIASTEYLTGLLAKSSTGRDKIASGLPAEDCLGHKSGMSDRTGDGIRMATGDVAALRLRDGSTAYLAILVKDSPESDEQTAGLFKELAQAVYDFHM